MGGRWNLITNPDGIMLRKKHVSCLMTSTSLTVLRRFLNDSGHQRTEKEIVEKTKDGAVEGKIQDSKVKQTWPFENGFLSPTFLRSSQKGNPYDLWAPRLDRTTFRPVDSAPPLPLDGRHDPGTSSQSQSQGIAA